MIRPRVLLADDHTIVAQGLAALLGDEFDLVGTASNGSALIEMANRMRPHVIVSDIAMPKVSGLEALRQLKQMIPELKLIFLTMHGEPKLAAEALRAGASGYLLKQSAGEELIEAIRHVLQGRTYVTPQIAENVLAALSDPSGTVHLTPRQRDVLRHVAQGKTLKQIASALGISPRTVETHKYEMMQTLGVTTTAELIRFAIQLETELG